MNTISNPTSEHARTDDLNRIIVKDWANGAHDVQPLYVVTKVASASEPCNLLFKATNYQELPRVPLLL